jgi:hypothetical protein
MENTLIPRTKIDSKGKLAYSESSQAWNILQIKKELFSEFPQLKEKRSKFSYKLVYHRDPIKFEKEIKELVGKGQKVMPLLVWLYKD